MNEEETRIVERLNDARPQFMHSLRGSVAAVSRADNSCTMTFDITVAHCHSGDIIQGGFVTAMLDAVTAHAVMAHVPGLQWVASLEIKVSFLEASRAGRYRAVGVIDRQGASIAFLSGQLITEDGRLTATATTTAKLIRKRVDEA